MGELQALLNREADGFEPSPEGFDRAVGRARRRQLRRRILAGAMALVVAISGFVLVLAAFGHRGMGGVSSPSGTSPYQQPTRTYYERTRTWHISYPAQYRTGSISIFDGRVSFEGAWVANFIPRFAAQALPSNVPANGVIVEVVQRSGGPFFIPRVPDTRFPISLGRFRAVGGAGSGWRSVEIVANGEPYTLSANVGPLASESDRASVASIVSSFGLRPVQPGTIVRGVLNYWVLQPPALYPVGSVTRHGMPKSSSSSPFPFYLVHVPQGFYALAWPADHDGGYKHCDVRYDLSNGEFSCPNGARWALDGSVIAKPGPSYQADPLEVLLVRISLDGDVMVCPNVFEPDTTTDLRVT